MSSDLDRVVAVLVNDALSPLQVFLLGLLLPPVHQVTLAVHLTALVLVSFILVQSEERERTHIKPVGQLVANYPPKGSIVHVLRSNKTNGYQCGS